MTPRGLVSGGRGRGVRWRLVATLAGLLVIACGRPPVAGHPDPAVVADVAVSIENHYAGTLTIYLDAHGTSLRLGEVGAQGSPSFVVPYRRVAPDGVFRLRGEVIGSAERVLTEPIRAQPGQLVRWTLRAALGMSSVSVY